jgi:osmotically-inducible protein OsmY
MQLDQGRIPLVILRALLPLVIALAAGCATVTGNDPGSRSLGTMIDDQGVESLARQTLYDADKRFESSHLSIVCFDGVLLLAGEVENQEMIDLAQQKVQELRTVRVVHNALSVSGPISLVASSNDSWLTTKVKTKLVAHDGIDSDRIKVVTENSVVYLMGKVPRTQADYAVEAASTVGGITKIVKVFEYLD